MLLVGIIVVIAIEYWQYGLQREMTIVVKNAETAAYDLFDKQFSHLLTVMSIFLGVFGLIVPFLAYFFQRESLRDERKRILDEVHSHEQDLFNSIGTLKEELSNSRNAIRNELESQRQEMACQIKAISSARDGFERELAYRLGMHFYISGSGVHKQSLGKIMDLLYALDQFGKFPDYTKSMRMIDPTLANMFELFHDKDAYPSLSLHWSYTLEALKILRRISGITTLKPDLRDVARTMARNIAMSDVKRRKKNTEQ